MEVGQTARKARGGGSQEGGVGAAEEGRSSKTQGEGRGKPAARRLMEGEVAIKARGIAKGSVCTQATNY
jgi:hypothetical protein